MRPCVLIILTVLSLGRFAALGAADERAEFFESRIRPVLVRHCYECHSAASAEGKLRLDFRGGWEQGGESGPAIVPGDPGSSLLITLLRHPDADRAMPQGAGRLPEDTIAAFEEWIRAGSYDPREHPPSAEEAAGTAWEAVLAERRRWWSLQPVARAPVPEVRNNTWSAHPVDRFILSELEERGLSPAARAERAALVRRLHFALTGLPPAPRDVAGFIADESPHAWEALVDRLLASPHFGERWARHWMDVVRYTDTYGYEWDIPAKGAWRYRDYLIRAFNGDVPFDRLLREHIAGDLLAQPRINETEQINESLIGPMFFQMGEKRHGDSAEFDGIHQEMLHNKIDAFSKAFQAMTIGCARCHDHKLDAVAQKDYYALAGVFMSSRWVTNTVDQPERNRDRLARLRDLKSQLQRELASWWIQESRQFAEYLVSTQLALDGSSIPANGAANFEPDRLEAWKQALTGKAGEEPAMEDPLFPWRQLATAEEPIDVEWRELAERYATQTIERVNRNAGQFKLIADFRQGVPDGWSVDGVGIRDGAVPCGELTVAIEGETAVARLVPGGFFTHALSPRMNGAVRTPFLNTLGSKFVSIECAGGDFSAHRTVIDNAFLTERQVYLKQNEPGWTQFSTFQEMPDRRIYVELATKTSNPNFPPRVGLGGPCSEEQARDPRSWFGIVRVVTHDQPGTPADELQRFARLFQGEPPSSREEAARRVGDWLSAAIERWAGREADEDDVRLINWLLDKGLLPNRCDDGAPEPIRQLVAAYRETERQLAEPQTVHGLADLDSGFDYRLNIRGVYDDLGPLVPRGYAQVFGDRAIAFASEGSGRRQLAELIASPENPLTARVYVNRVWHWLFGKGLVATPDDFGKLGDPPSHPELLDYLAAQFVENGWSTKELVRTLVLTEAFRQSGDVSPSAAEVDPDNRLLHHFPLRRLEAEAVRDSLLAVSGRLDLTPFGPPVDPPRANEDPQKRLFSGPLDGNGRRSLYTKITIMEPPKFLATFNQPDPKIPTGRRDLTNVPAQALALLNDPFVLGQAEFWATRLVATDHASVDERVKFMFQKALGREPSTAELDRWNGAIAEFAALHGADHGSILHSAGVWKDVAHALFNTKEFIYVR